MIIVKSIKVKEEFIIINNNKLCFLWFKMKYNMAEVKY